MPWDEDVTSGSEIDFLLAVGDGKTDEVVFQLLDQSPNTITCTVGKKQTRAHYYLDNVDEVRGLLSTLADDDAGASAGVRHSHNRRPSIVAMTNTLLSTSTF